MLADDDPSKTLADASTTPVVGTLTARGRPGAGRLRHHPGGPLSTGEEGSVSHRCRHPVSDGIDERTPCGLREGGRFGAGRRARGPSHSPTLTEQPGADRLGPGIGDEHVRLQGAGQVSHFMVVRAWKGADFVAAWVAIAVIRTWAPAALGCRSPGDTSAGGGRRTRLYVSERVRPRNPRPRSRTRSRDRPSGR
jgi:hypothetical protein